LNSSRQALYGLANGNTGVLHSIILNPEENLEDVPATDEDGFINLNYPPAYVNIQPDKHSIQKTYNIKGVSVIPIEPTNLIKSNSINGLHFHSRSYELGFSCTFYKVMGKTLSHLILDFSTDHTKAKLKCSSVYVTLTRVKVKLLKPTSYATWFNIVRLSHTKELKKWIKSRPFDEC